jgi:hypothetical protein
MNRQKCKFITEEAHKALKSLEEKHGVKIGIKSARYDSTSTTVKIEISEVQDGSAMTTEAKNFMRLAEVYSLNPDWLFKTFKTRNGETFKVIGLKPRATKRPILMEKISGNSTSKVVASESFLKNLVESN